MPLYYCDHCGHAFSTPFTKGNNVLNHKDKNSSWEICPKCENRDFELIEDYDSDRSDTIHPPHPLDSRFLFADSQDGRREKCRQQVVNKAHKYV